MPLVACAIERLEGKKIKEFGVFKNGIVLGYSFLPPSDCIPTSQAEWNNKNHMGLSGTMENLNTLSCRQFLTNVAHLQENSLQNGSENRNLLSNYLSRCGESRGSWLSKSFQTFQQNGY